MEIEDVPYAGVNRRNRNRTVFRVKSKMADQSLVENLIDRSRVVVGPFW